MVRLSVLLCLLSADILAEEAPIETRDIVNRRLHSADRRGGRHLSHFILDAASPLEEEEEDGGVEDSRDGAILRRPDGYPLSVTPTEDRDASRHRHGSMLSMYSDRSSGYFSQRSYSVTSMYLDHPLDHPVSEATQQLEQLQVSHEASPEPQPTSLSSPSSSSSSSSSSSAPSSTVDDDFQSCSSGSLESLPSSSGSLPRSVTAGVCVCVCVCERACVYVYLNVYIYFPYMRFTHCFDSCAFTKHSLWDALYIGTS